MWKVKDRWNNEIILTEERWEHIKYWHPDLEDHLDEVLQTVKVGKRRQDIMDPNKYSYIRETKALLPEYNFIVAIVKLALNNFIITAYPKFK